MNRADDRKVIGLFLFVACRARGRAQQGALVNPDERLPARNGGATWRKVRAAGAPLEEIVRMVNDFDAEAPTGTPNSLTILTSLTGGPPAPGPGRPPGESNEGTRLSRPAPVGPSVPCGIAAGRARRHSTPSSSRCDAVGGGASDLGLRTDCTPESDGRSPHRPLRDPWGACRAPAPVERRSRSLFGGSSCSLPLFERVSGSEVRCS